jgi:hypothetical protein
MVHRFVNVMLGTMVMGRSVEVFVDLVNREVQILNSVTIAINQSDACILPD